MKPLTQAAQQRANLSTAIAKLRKRGLQIGDSASADYVAGFICEQMSWCKRGSHSVIERYINHKPGKVAKPRQMLFRAMRSVSPEMQRAYERAGEQRFITMGG